MMRQAKYRLQERLWLVCLDRWCSLSRVALLLDEDPQALALVLTEGREPASVVRQRRRADDLQLKSREAWMLDRLARTLRLNRRETRSLKRVLEPVLAGYGRRHWLEKGGAPRAQLLERGVKAHILVDLAMLAGFSLWQERYQAGPPRRFTWRRDPHWMRQGDRELHVTLQQLDFPSSERLVLVEGLDHRLRRKLMDHSAAGELAYRSLELALQQKLEGQT